MSSLDNVVITPMFSTPIYYAKTGYVVGEEIIKSLQDGFQITGTGSYENDDYEILHKPQFSELKAVLTEHVDAFWKQVLNYTNNEWQFTTTWVNKNPKGTYHNLHKHPNSVLSGVYYIDVPENSSGLTFHDPRERHLRLKPSVENEFTATQAVVGVSSGDLLLFPSDIYHEVTKNEADGMRISLAFNTWFTGQLEY